jgi:hypothetical protein
MVEINQALRLPADQIKEQIKIRQALKEQMVGTLYPSCTILRGRDPFAQVHAYLTSHV